MAAKITQRSVQSAKPRTAPYEVRDAELKGFLLRIQPTGYKAFYFEHGRGKAKRVRLGSAAVLTVAQARQKARELSVAAEQGVRPGEAAPKPKAAPRLSEWLETYGKHFRTHHRTDRWLRELRQFRDLYSMRIDRIDRDVVRDWRAGRLEGGAKPATVNRNVAALKACLSHAVDVGLLAEHPIKRLPQLKVEQEHRIRWLAVDEEQRLRTALDEREARIRGDRRSGNEWRDARGYDAMPELDNLPFADHLKPMVLVSLNTGLRQGELFNLDWTDVVAGTVHVRAATAKSAKSRHVPLNREARTVLDGWSAHTGPAGYVFPGRGGGRLDNVRKSWAAVLDDAGLENFRWHDMRHHFASKLVMAGAPLNTVRELLGHSDLKMTLRYAHLAPDHTRAAVELLDE